MPRIACPPGAFHYLQQSHTPTLFQIGTRRISDWLNGLFEKVKNDSSGAHY